MDSFAKDVKEIRKEKGLTLLKLAKKSNVSFMTIYFLEHGRVKTRLMTAMKIAKALEKELVVKNNSYFYLKK